MKDYLYHYVRATESLAVDGGDDEARGFHRSTYFS